MSQKQSLELASVCEQLELSISPILNSLHAQEDSWLCFELSFLNLALASSSLTSYPLLLYCPF